jgi:putative transposase
MRYDRSVNPNEPKELTHPMSTLNYKQVREEYLDVMQEHIELTTSSTKCPQEFVCDILGLAAVDTTSVHGACDLLEDGPTSAAVWYQLRQGWLDAQTASELETQLNTVLVSRLPPRIRPGWQDLALDLTLLPYHGEPAEDANEIRRSAAKARTTHFHAYASAYIIRHNKRVTVAVAYWRADESLLALLQRLLERVHTYEIRIRRLLVDRQFCTVNIFKYLDQQAWQSIIPVPARSRELKDLQQQARRSHQRRYTMSSAQDGDFTFDLHVVCQYAMGRRGKHGIDVYYFAVLGRPWTGSAHSLARLYGRRFGIETSYRLMNTLRIRTSSRDPKLRLLFVGLAFILMNLWVYLSWTMLAVPRRGGRYLPADLFRLDKFRHFLRAAIYHIRPPVLSVSRPTGVF